MTDPIARPRGPVLLATAARVVSWPLAAFGLLLGLVVRVVVAPIRVLRGQRAAIGAYLEAGQRYLAFQTIRFPPLLSPVPTADESPGPWNEARRRICKSRVALWSWIGTCAYLYLGVLVQFGWLAAGFSYADRDAVFVEPSWFSGAHPLGTDQLGRDVLALSVASIRTAMLIGTLSALLSCVIGTTLGALAGYFGRWVDVVIVWLYTTVESIPYVLLLVAFAFILKKNDDFKEFYDSLPIAKHVSIGLFTIILTLGLTSWVGVCRQVRAEFIRQRDRDYVVAAHALGLPSRNIVFRQILPNVFHLVLVSFSLLFISTVKFEVILSFLGLGLEPGEASWGSMIGQAQLELTRDPSVWWQLTSATVFMFVLVLCVNLFADALRDALDPRLKT